MSGANGLQSSMNCHNSVVFQRNKESETTATSIASTVTREQSVTYAEGLDDTVRDFSWDSGRMVCCKILKRNHLSLPTKQNTILCKLLHTLELKLNHHLILFTVHGKRDS